MSFTGSAGRAALFVAPWLAATAVLAADVPYLSGRVVDEAEILSIGVDSNQNYLHPGKVLTSMLKRVDNAVYEAFKAGPDLATGISVMDVAAGGIDYALGDNNAALVTEEMKAAVDDAKAKIVSGELKVHDYMSDDSCPVS